MRWGFLGIGRVTDRMASIINGIPSHQLACVAGRDASKLKKWSEKHHPARTTINLDDAYSDSGVDAVYVALPPNLHAQYSIRAMEAGKTVLCEKPLAYDHKQALSIQECSLRTGIPCYHATSFPFHPRSLKMRDVIRSGALGELRRITIACSASHILSRGNDHRLTPELGGGCILDLGWYCVYATLWFTGLKPVSISAFGSRDRSSGIWISAQALVLLEGGAVAHWDCGFDAAGRKWIEFAGTDASMICDDFLRPWDNQKPRFWIHGHDGKAACETVISEMTQEELMIHQIQENLNPDVVEALDMAIATQHVLELWENKLIDGSDSL